jgi:hypothetical protein
MLLYMHIIKRKIRHEKRYLFQIEHGFIPL